MRGIFFTYRKLGEAKFRVKQKRANINMEGRVFDSRGGRSAAMDSSTARPGGQKRQGRSRDDGDDRGAPVARGGDSGAAAARGSDEQPDGEMEAEFSGDDEVAIPTADFGANIFAIGAGEHPAADGATASGSPGTDPTTMTQDACAGEAGDRPSAADDQVAHGLPAGSASEITGSGPGQVGGLNESPSRRASPGHIAPSHRAGDAMANRDVRPGSSPDNDGNAGVAPPTHGGGPGAFGAEEVPADHTSSFPLGATCAGGLALAVAHDSSEGPCHGGQWSP